MSPPSRRSGTPSLSWGFPWLQTWQCPSVSAPGMHMHLPWAYLAKDPTPLPCRLQHQVLHCCGAVAAGTSWSGRHGCPCVAGAVQLPKSLLTGGHGAVAAQAGQQSAWPISCRAPPQAWERVLHAPRRSAPLLPRPLSTPTICLQTYIPPLLFHPAVHGPAGLQPDRALVPPGARRGARQPLRQCHRSPPAEYGVWPGGHRQLRVRGRRLAATVLYH